MKFNLAIPYVVKQQDRDPQPQMGMDGKVTTVPSYWAVDRQITERLIERAIDAKYPEGVGDPSVRKTNGKIAKILIRAINAKEDWVSFERGQVEHVVRAIKDWTKCPTAWCSVVDDLLEALEAALKADDAVASPSNGTEKPALEHAKA